MKPQILGYYLRHEIRTGGHKRYLELLNSLSKKGWSVTVFLSNTIDNNYSFNILPLDPVKTGGFLPFSVKQAFRIFPKLLKLRKGRWITIAFGETNYLTLKFVKLILKAKIVFAFRSNTYKAKVNQLHIYNTKRSIKNNFDLLKMLKIEKGITKISDILVFQTEIDKEDIICRTKSTRSKCHIIPNSLRESWFNEDYKFTNKSDSLKEVVYLGSYDDRKGAYFLLQAFKLLKEKGIELNLTLFGSGQESIKLQKYIDDNNLSKNITLNGKLNNPIQFLGKYDLMVTPSIYDSYPNVILESLFTGTPVIGSDNSGMKTILDYKDLLFETGNSAQIASKLEALYNDNNMYKKIYNLCLERAKYHDFSWPNRFEEVLNTLY